MIPFKSMVVFLSGVLLALLIFGFVLPLFPNVKIEYTSKASVAEWLVAAGTIGAVLAALFGEFFKKRFFPPKIRIMKNEIKPTPQGESFYWRVPVKNFGEGEAVEVGVDIVAVSPHPNFENIEVPLTWTHKNTSRNIYSKQQVHFNLLEYPSPFPPYSFASYIDDQGAYKHLEAGRYDVRLVILREGRKKMGSGRVYGFKK